MVYAHKPYFVFRRKERVYLNRRGRQFSRLLTAEVCASAVVMLDTPCSEVVWRVLAYPLHSPVSPSLPSRASPCAITFQLESTTHRRLFINSLNSSTANTRVNDGYQRPVDTSSTNSDDGDTAGARNISFYPLIDEADNQTVNFVNIFPVKA